MQNRGKLYNNTKAIRYNLVFQNILCKHLQAIWMHYVLAMLKKVLVNSSLILKESYLSFSELRMWLLLLQHVFQVWKYLLWSSIKLSVTFSSETQIHKEMKYSWSDRKEQASTPQVTLQYV